MVPARALLTGFLVLAAAHPLSAQPAIAVSVRAAWAALDVDLHLAVEPFYVRGHTFAEARRALDREGPISSDGLPRHAVTVYEIAARWSTERTARACRITEATVTADIVIHLPRWVEVREASRRDYDTWQMLDRELTTHEHEHRDLALRAAYRLARELRGLEASSCPALGHRAGAISAKVKDELSRAQEALDAPTPRAVRARAHRRR